MESESRERVLRAIRSGYHGEYITFSRPDQLFAALPPKRWLVIDKLQHIGPSSLRALARELGRDVKRVHEDVAVLVEYRVIERDENKRLVVPYDEIRFEFSLFGQDAA